MKRHDRNIMQSLLALALPVTLIACGGAGTTSSDTGSTGNGTGSAVTTLASIPRATAPVVGSTSGNLALGKTAGSAGTDRVSPPGPD